MQVQRLQLLFSLSHSGIVFKNLLLNHLLVFIPGEPCFCHQRNSFFGCNIALNSSVDGLQKHRVRHQDPRKAMYVLPSDKTSREGQLWFSPWGHWIFQVPTVDMHAVKPWRFLLLDLTSQISMGSRNLLGLPVILRAS